MSVCVHKVKPVVNRHLTQWLLRLLITLFCVLPHVSADTLSINAVENLAAKDVSQPLLDQARQLLREKAPLQAYLLLANKEVELAGDITFDYLLGMSALAAKRYLEATIALERVLIINPKHIGARLDIGVAFLKMGALERASDAFNQVLAANPPEHLKVIAKDALLLIQSRSAGSSSPVKLEARLDAYIAFTLGYDSNINTSTSITSTEAYFNGLPISLNLDPTSTAKSDPFTRLSGGISYLAPVSEKSQLEIDLDLSLLMPFEYDEFKKVDTSLNLGYQYFDQNSRWSLAANLGGSWLDDEDYITYDGLTAGWRHVMNGANLLDLSAQWTRFRYQQPSQSINDFDQTLVSGLLLHRLPGKSVFASFGGLAGYADAQNNSADGDKVFAGLSLGLQGNTPFSDNGFIRLAWKKSQHDKTNLAFLRKRQDDQLDIRAGLTWYLMKDVALSGEIGFTELNSNIDIYSYQRRTIGLTLRKSFSD